LVERKNWQKIGIFERHIVAENELSSDLGIAAAEKLLMNIELIQKI